MLATLHAYTARFGVSIATAGLLLLFAGQASADEHDPYAKADDTWITISGTVDSVRRDNFTLDYGDGLVIVEMDDGDRDADAYKLLAGDKVTVTGRVDDDLFENTKIEASSVFVENLNTTFYASAVDEETTERLLAAVTVPVVVSNTVVQGTVTDVDTNEFTVDAGVRQIRVDVTEMPYNPLDDEGYQRISAGDRVRVQGSMTSNLIEGRELEADSVVKLNM